MSETVSSHAPEADQLRAEQERYHAFINLALLLAAVTGVELVLVYLPFHPQFILWTLTALSLFKFCAVIAWFMHLIYDRLLLTLLFGAGLSIATATVIALLFLMSPSHVDMEAVTGL